MNKDSGMSKVSIIIPVYQTEDYIEECVRSYLAQTHEDLEVLLIDDGSTDGSGRICDELAAKDARVRVIHQQNGGVSKARNRGLQEATGDFIVFGDSDDWVDANLLEWLLAKRKASGADVVCHAYARELKEGTEYPSKALPKTFMTADEYIAGSLGESSGMILSACLALYPAEAAKALRFREDLPYGEDSLYLCTLLSRISSVYYEPEALYHYRVIREGNTLGTTSLAKLEKVISASRAMAAVWEKTPGSAWHYLLRLVADNEIEAARQAHAEGNKTAFIRHRNEARKLASRISRFSDIPAKARLRRCLSAASPILGVGLYNRMRGFES